MFTNHVDMQKGGEVLKVSIIINLAQCAVDSTQIINLDLCAINVRNIFFLIFQISQWYELVVFTASMEIYGTAVGKNEVLKM